MPTDVVSVHAQHLIDRGWKLIKRKFVGSHYVCLWDHPDHRHETHRCFTQTEAVNYQKELDRNAKRRQTRIAETNPNRHKFVPGAAWDYCIVCGFSGSNPSHKL